MQIFAYICWLFLAYLMVGKAGDILVGLFAPFPEWVCLLLTFYKSLASICPLLAIDAIMITKHLFIFNLQVNWVGEAAQWSACLRDLEFFGSIQAGAISFNYRLSQSELLTAKL